MKEPTKPIGTRPAATPNIPGASDVPEVTLPDINTLSLLAAQPRFHPQNETDAIRSALALWREANRLLERERNLIILRHQNYLAPLQRVKTPKKWPGNFADFLRLVVGGKDKGEQLNRFRRYILKNIRSEAAFKAGEPEPEGPASKGELDQIEQQLSGFEALPIPQFVWEHDALGFDKWWALERVQAKRRGGKARVAKARERKKVAKAA